MRVRFAPSPTGYLHVGGARTAVFNWLMARRAGGAFILRIEDTDRARSTEEHTEAILDGLRWLGLDWDEGPYLQSEGLDRHRRHARQLLEEGRAYRDFSDREQVRAIAEERGVHPSRVARELADAMDPARLEELVAEGAPHAIRFRVPDGETVFEDLVHGEMRFENEHVDDLVVLRSDGTPVYNLAVVSDDAEMRVTHVVRGDDHLSNTPKQALLHRALGLPEPVFGHVPLILGADGKRLSKRHGATSVSAYAEEGILPEAMLNFLALLGWSPGDDREVMGRAELMEAFSMDRVLKKSAVFDVEKLAWLSGRHLAERPTAELRDMVREGARSLDAVHGELLDDADRVDVLVDLLKVRARTLAELTEQAHPFVSDAYPLDERAAGKHWYKDPPTIAERLERLRATLEAAEWSAEGLERALRSLAEELGVGAGKLIHPARVALTGKQTSPGIFEVMLLLGPERVSKRLSRAAEHIRTR